MELSELKQELKEDIKELKEELKESLKELKEDWKGYKAEHEKEHREIRKDITVLKNTDSTKDKFKGNLKWIVVQAIIILLMIIGIYLK